MLSIPQGAVWRCFCALLIWSFLPACQQDGGAGTSTQRRISEARMQDDLFLSLTYGSVRGFTSDQVVMRSASPLVEITMEAGATAFGPIDVELRNQHLDAELRIAAVTYLDAEDLDGCPVVTGFEVDCVAATAAIGDSCETSGQCPEGLRCAQSECQPSDSFELCIPPDIERLRGQETSIDFELPVAACTRVRMQTMVEATADSTLRFAVVGPSRSAEVIAQLGTAFRDADIDFVVLLGENAPATDEDGLSELERTVTQLGTPAVVLAGPREVALESGQQYLRRFGPHDHVWTLKGTRFFAFFSAQGTLGNRGLTRLEGFLNLLQTEDESPLIGVTHVPPFDPNDLRDNSFRNDVEASQVMSLLEEHGVHQLYAGGLGTGYEQILGVETYVTTARGTVAQPSAEWMLVEVAPSGDGREVGDVIVTTKRIDL